MKKLILFAVLPLLLLIGAGAGAFLAGMIPGAGPEGGFLAEMFKEAPKPDPDTVVPPPASAPSPETTAFFILPEFVVNLQTKRTYPVFLLLSMSIEIRDEGAQPEMAAAEARIRDAMIVFLSSLTPNDLNGYEGIERIRTNTWRILHRFVDPKILVNVQISKMTVK